MLDLHHLLLLLALALVAIYLRSAIRSNELARHHARQYCQDMRVQFLDDSVISEGLRFSKGRDGQWRLWRNYRFEFTFNGSARYQGEITLHGRRVVRCWLEPHVV